MRRALSTTCKTLSVLVSPSIHPSAERKTKNSILADSRDENLPWNLSTPIRLSFQLSVSTSVRPPARLMNEKSKNPGRQPRRSSLDRATPGSPGPQPCHGPRAQIVHWPSPAADLADKGHRCPAAPGFVFATPAWLMQKRLGTKNGNGSIHHGQHPTHLHTHHHSTIIRNHSISVIPPSSLPLHSKLHLSHPPLRSLMEIACMQHISNGWATTFGRGAAIATAATCAGGLA